MAAQSAIGRRNELLAEAMDLVRQIQVVIEQKQADQSDPKNWGRTGDAAHLATALRDLVEALDLEAVEALRRATSGSK